MKDARDPGTMELAIGASWKTMDGIEQSLIQLQAEAAKKREAYNRAKAEMDSLKAKGLIYAGTHYKAGKYLYLVYPVADDGSRERKYIGADPEKIKAALAGIERGTEYQRLEVRMQQLKSRAARCNEYLTYAHSAIRG